MHGNGVLIGSYAAVRIVTNAFHDAVLGAGHLIGADGDVRCAAPVAAA
jgi:hypothetical protein